MAKIRVRHKSAKKPWKNLQFADSTSVSDGILSRKCALSRNNTTKMGGFPSTLFALTAAQVATLRILTDGRNGKNSKKKKTKMLCESLLYQVNCSFFVTRSKKKITNFSLYYLAKFDSKLI